MRRLALACAAAAVAALGGCGTADGGGEGVAEDPAAAAREYAACMRENGVDVPDPDPATGMVLIEPGLDQDRLAEANEACADLAPGLTGPDGGGPDPAQLEQSRRFAECMRANGLPDFPDPAADGSLSVPLGDGGIDPDSPEARAAQEACREFAPGMGGGR